MLESNDLRVKRTYKLLSNALIFLMRKLPFEKITITDICNEAMVHRTTFYTHFCDKYDLLKYALSEFEKPFDDIEIKETTREGYRDYYMSVAKKTIDYINDNSDIFTQMLIKNKSDTIINFFRESITKKLEEKLIQMEKSGIKFSAPLPLICNIYSGGCINVIIWWLENERPFSADELIKYLKLIIDPIISRSYLNETN